jgi:hypothetical protein
VVSSTMRQISKITVRTLKRYVPEGKPPFTGTQSICNTSPESPRSMRKSVSVTVGPAACEVDAVTVAWLALKLPLNLNDEELESFLGLTRISAGIVVEIRRDKLENSKGRVIAYIF